MLESNLFVPISIYFKRDLYTDQKFSSKVVLLETGGIRAIKNIFNVFCINVFWNKIYQNYF